jgi:putative chitinase
LLGNQEFAALFPMVPPRLWNRYQDALNTAMAEFAINTMAREAAFLAQIGHETMGLRYMEELGGPEYFTRLYEHRADLGNDQPGDGALYHGRGFIQLTGRKNYRDVGHALGLMLEQYPSLAAEPATGARIAGYFWKSHGLNELADLATMASFEDITRRINGGLNGFEDRKDKWAKARSILGLPLVEVA